MEGAVNQTTTCETGKYFFFFSFPFVNIATHFNSAVFPAPVSPRRQIFILRLLSSVASPRGIILNGVPALDMAISRASVLERRLPARLIAVAVRLKAALMVPAKRARLLRGRPYSDVACSSSVGSYVCGQSLLFFLWGSPLQAMQMLTADRFSPHRASLFALLLPCPWAPGRSW